MAEPEKRFHVALSFPGEHRGFVAGVAGLLSKFIDGDLPAAELSRSRVLYDKFHEEEFARLNLDTYLQKLYHDESQLIVVFLCADYERKEWPGLEWRAIRDLIKKKRDSTVMLIRMDSADVSGVFSIDGYVSADGRTPAEIAALIRGRLNRVATEHQAATSPSSTNDTTAAATLDNPYGGLLEFIGEETKHAVREARKLSSVLPDALRAEPNLTYIPPLVSDLAGGHHNEWKQVSSALSESSVRKIVLGETGSGKTRLAYHEVYTRGRCLLSECSGNLLPRSQLRFAVVIRAADHRLWEQAITDAVLSILGDRHKGVWTTEIANELGEKIVNGQCLLVVDGMDEASHYDGLHEHLQTFFESNPQASVLLTSRREGYQPRKGLIPNRKDVHTLEPFGPESIESAISAWLSDCREAMALMRGRVSVGNSAIIKALYSPQRLMMACYVARESVQRPGSMPQWTTAHDLYTCFVDELFVRWKDRGGPATEHQRNHYKRFLAELALQMTEREAHGKPGEQVEGPTLQNLIKRVKDRILKDLDCGSEIVRTVSNDRELDALCDSGLFVRDVDSHYRWWHATFQQFFTAEALRYRLADADAEHLPKLWAIVDAITWDPLRVETVVFLASGLSGTRPNRARELLERLSDAAMDDLYSHRLIVAALCLPDLAEGSRLALQSQISEITTLCTQLWLWVNRYTEFHYFYLLDHAVQGLAITNGRLKIATANHLMLHQLHRKDGDDPYLQSWADDTPFLEWVAKVPGQEWPPPDVRRWHTDLVLLTLVRPYLMGPNTKAFLLEKLSAGLQDPNPDVQSRALCIFIHFPEFHGEAPVLKAFSHLLIHFHGGEYGSADRHRKVLVFTLLRVLGERFPGQALPNEIWCLLLASTDFRQQPDPEFREVALATLHKFVVDDRVGKQDSAVDRLIDIWLHDPKPTVRNEAVWTLTRVLGPELAVSVMRQRSAGFHDTEARREDDLWIFERAMNSEMELRIQQWHARQQSGQETWCERDWLEESDRILPPPETTTESPGNLGTRHGFLQGWLLPIGGRHVDSSERPGRSNFSWKLWWHFGATFPSQLETRPNAAARIDPGFVIRRVDRLIEKGFRLWVVYIAGTALLELIVYHDMRVFVSLTKPDTKRWRKTRRLPSRIELLKELKSKNLCL